MTVGATFDWGDENYSYKCKAEDLKIAFGKGRYAYFTKKVPNFVRSLFEINILKDEDGNLIEKGYVAFYKSIDDSCPYKCFDADIKFLRNNEEISAKFDWKGKHYSYKCKYEKLDRNYEDESYAYFLKTIPIIQWSMIQINVNLDDDLNLTNEGSVWFYNDKYDSLPRYSLSISIDILQQ